MNGPLEKKILRLEALVEMSSLINSTLDTDEIRNRAIEAATRLVHAEAGSLLLVDQGTGELFFEVAVGDKGDAVRQIRLARGEGIAGWVAEKGEPLIVHDVQSDSRFFRKADARSSFHTKDMICVPVKTRDRILGVLQAINKREGTFDAEDLEGLLALSNQIAIAIENANLYKELKEDFYETTHALAETIEQRDPYTGGHTHRVMYYSLSVGKRMGLSDAELEQLKLAAILHDVGKIGVPDSILLKNGRLDRDEVLQMNLHPEFGVKILSHVKKLKTVMPGVRSHHEKYDGSGYPDRIQGDSIPLMARIIAAADTFDAMTTDRPYRKALTTQAAIEELHRCSGTQFDPDVVNHFAQILTEGAGHED